MALAPLTVDFHMKTIICICTLLALLLAHIDTGEQRRPTFTPAATPVPTLPPLPQGSARAPVLAGALVVRTAHLDLYAAPGGLEREIVRALAPRFEQALAAVAARIGARPRGRTAIGFGKPQQGPCALRGRTRSAQRRIELFYAPGSDQERVLGIVAHELAHQMQHDRYGPQVHSRSDTILLEGMAVWASDDYRRDEAGQPLWKREVAEAAAAGALLPLVTSLVADCRTTTRVSIYAQWASFVDYLRRAYGAEKLDALYADSTGRAPGAANYRRIYGKRLAALESEWRETVIGGVAGGFPF
jgi:hypothetical protein